MKRGNLILSLFLVSILFISGCAQFSQDVTSDLTIHFSPITKSREDTQRTQSWLDVGCESGDFDNPAQYCDTGMVYQIYGECTSSYDCSGETPYCDPNEYYCVDCLLSAGDINGDGSFNVLDVVSLASCVLGGNCSQLGSSCVIDVNGDGSYNVLDIVQLTNCILAQNCGG